jgi:hypothetical protein
MRIDISLCKQGEERFMIRHLQANRLYSVPLNAVTLIY